MHLHSIVILLLRLPSLLIQSLKLQTLLKFVMEKLIQKVQVNTQPLVYIQIHTQQIQAAIALSQPFWMFFQFTKLPMKLRFAKVKPILKEQTITPNLELSQMSIKLRQDVILW